MSQDKNQWCPIPVTYTELLPRLLERQLIALSHPSIKPPFPKWYNPNVHCDYHAGKPGHSTDDCNSLKHKVQVLIKMGLINFESPDQLNNLSLKFSRVRTAEVKKFATISGGIQGRMTGYTAKKTEEEKKASKLQEENEELRRLVQDMAHMLKGQKESVTLLRGVYDR